MPKIEVTGLEEFVARIKRLADSQAIEDMQKVAVYAGQAEVLKEIKAQIQGLPEQEGYIPESRLPRNVVTRKEKQQLIEHLGISTMENKDGTVSNSVSFTGYTNIITKKHPQGIPTILLARSINSGSSVRKKIPFIRHAKAAVKFRAQTAAVKAAEELLQKYIKD